jgi:glucose-1-phosphate cytidylyltransferase
MQAVILAGGLGTRMREETEFIPKPMVEIGGKPILWHLMKLLSQQGINDFVICTGYKSEVIRDYFTNYNSKNLDFTAQLGGSDRIVFHGSHQESNWNVTVADTGQLTMTGGRVKKIQKYIGDERFFLTYGDGLANVDLPSLIETHERLQTTVTLTTTRPTSRFGVVSKDNDGRITAFLEKPKSTEDINIGFMIAEPGLFAELGENDVLEEKPLRSLASRSLLGSYHHGGFWQPMDTQREARALNLLWDEGSAPWKIWD